MKQNNTYFGGLLHGINTLATGLGVTIKEFFTKKVTEQYPENRRTLTMFDHYKGKLCMPHNDQNQHKCIGCGLCQMACPNGTLNVESEFYETEDGKKKKQLVKYEYNQGSCMFCELCVTACPHDAITFDQDFENAVFNRSKLILTLNREGSKVIEKS